MPVGYVDHPRDCLQAPLSISFNHADGHLWIAGSPGSGKAMTLHTILTSLALTHTPDEINFYLLECGASNLKRFESLPHTGALIRITEQERVERLLNFLDDELDQRTTQTGEDEQVFDTEVTRPYPPTSAASLRKNADIFFVINNFAEIRTSYPDYVERISRHVRDGKSAGIHLIITTNRGTELPRMISNNIARRLVLQMASRDEYLDITQRMIGSLSARASGRGLWVNEDVVVECQISQPKLVNGDDGNGFDPDHRIQQVFQSMARNWGGSRPKLIGTIPTNIALETAYPLTQTGVQQPLVPLGISYETLEPFVVNLFEEVSQWLVLGAKQKGKSSFLATIAEGLLKENRDSWEVIGYALRRSAPLAALAKRDPGLTLFSTSDDILQNCQTQLERLKAHPVFEKRLLILIDDLDVAYEPGRESLRNVFEITGTISAGPDGYLFDRQRRHGKPAKWDVNSDGTDAASVQHRDGVFK